MSKDTETMKHNAEVAQSDTIRPNKKGNYISTRSFNSQREYLCFESICSFLLYNLILL